MYSIVHLAVFALVAAGMCRSATAAQKIDSKLPDPEHARSLETVERKVSAAGRVSDGLILAPELDSFLIKTPFAPDNLTREGVFGKMVESKRIPVGQKGESFDWRNFLPLSTVEPRVLAFDGGRFALFELDGKTLTELVRRGIAWDKVRPPKDRGGEATSVEISSFRSAFKNAMKKLKGRIASGMAPLPEAWFRNGRTNYMILSRLDRFPLLLTECQNDVPSQCVVTRACNLEGYSGSAASQLTGIAVRADRRELILSDSKNRQLHYLKFDSCYNVVYTRTRSTPDKLKDVTSIASDTDNRLFLTTVAPDDYLNASFYIWNASDW